MLELANEPVLDVWHNLFARHKVEALAEDKESLS